MITIQAISDSHNKHKRLELLPADILIHAGDLTMMGHEVEVKAVADWFKALLVDKYKHIVFVAGNHDWLSQKSPKVWKEFFDHPNIHYLENNSLELMGIHFYGSPVQPWFCDWAWNVERGPDIREYWDKIPENTDILVTHGPPMGYCDWTPYTNEHVGCEELEDTLVNRIKPKLHVCGHLHSGYSYKLHSNNETLIVGASICDEQYKPINSPWFIRYDEENKKVINIGNG